MKTTGFQYNGEFNANYDIIWSFKFALCGSSLQSQGAFCTFLKQSSSNLQTGLTANYLGYVNGFDYDTLNCIDTENCICLETESNTLTGSPPVDVGDEEILLEQVAVPLGYATTQGMSGALLGIAFDTTGYFALSTAFTECNTIPGIGRSQIIPNSLIIRGPAPDCEVLYNASLSSLTTNFTLLTTNETYCWLRFRMGNFFKTLTIDYRYSDDTQYLNLTSIPISIPIENTTFVNVGMSYSTPMTSSSTNEAIFRIKNFHVEGTNTYPNITLTTPVTATITTLLTETSAGKFTSDEVATEDDHIVLA
jgi:hypothetical protein